MDVVNLSHPLVSRAVRERIFPAAPAGDQLQAGIQHAGQQAVLKSLVKIADAVEFLPGPTGQEFVFIGTAEIAR